MCKELKEEDIEEMFDLLEATDNALYTKLYEKAYGCHFNEKLAKKAVSEMQNEDGTIGEHWSLSDTTSVMRNFGLKFDRYDWYYTLNMIYSDYYDVVPNELRVYVEMAKRFLTDKDGVNGKAFRYWKM